MDKWWKNSIGYQIYIKTFFDSDGNGTGDLNGIEQKLDYIKSIGVDFIWICPFYDSPMDDNGYDIRDYYMIDKTYGANEDLKRLIDSAHKKGLKILIDLVMNHTSDEHIWFQKSVDRIDPYTDYYVWKDAKIVKGKKCPPNNWQSFFTGSAWGWNEKRGQYFLKIFSKKMPDLNYESEAAFAEMEKIIEHYAKWNVDGFRVDAVAHIGKDLSFADSKNIKKTYKSFSNRENAHAYLKRFYKIFNKHNLFVIGETGGDPDENDIMRYTTEGELDAVFSFEQLGVLENKNHKINLKNLMYTLKFKHKISQNGGWSALFWLNHDYPRLLSRVRGENSAKDANICLAALMYYLKGTPIIFNGEEIGMENYPFSGTHDFEDVNAKMIFENTKNINKAFEKLKETSRDNARTAMQWDDAANAGFSTHKPAMHLNENYKQVNVKQENEDLNSILNLYRKLLAVRKKIGKDLCVGEYCFFNHDKVIGYKIKMNKNEYEVLANFSNKNKKLPCGKILFSNFKVESNLRPLQVVIVKI